jgi:8-oxo-dGTP pyrophosphatase MutT (NUDIX family)
MRPAMSALDGWDGARATLLQRALRLTIEDFAQRLSVSPRTIAAWHHEPERVPRPHAQRLLDRLLAQAQPAERARFEASCTGPTQTPITLHSLHVALAIVIKQRHVLLVRRRAGGPLAWQFPAGVVKPEGTAEDAAVTETLAETGIDCAARRTIGSRVHPNTGVYCVYLLCDYLAGEPENRDPVENTSVRWVPIEQLSNFIEETLIYPPALQAIKEGSS